MTIVIFCQPWLLLLTLKSLHWPESGIDMPSGVIHGLIAPLCCAEVPSAGSRRTPSQRMTRVCSLIKLHVRVRSMSPSVRTMTSPLCRAFFQYLYLLQDSVGQAWSLLNTCMTSRSDREVDLLLEDVTPTQSIDMETVTRCLSITATPTLMMLG